MSEQEFRTSLEDPQAAIPSPKASGNKGKLIGIIIAAVILLALIILSLVSLFRADLETTSKVRDIFGIITFGCCIDNTHYPNLSVD